MELAERLAALAADVVAWGATYLLHSTLFLGGAWIVLRFGGEWSPRVRERIAKLALVGGVVTATLQVTVGIDPALGRMGLPWLDADRGEVVELAPSTTEPGDAAVHVDGASGLRWSDRSARPRVRTAAHHDGDGPLHELRAAVLLRRDAGDPRADDADVGAGAAGSSRFPPRDAWPWTELALGLWIAGAAWGLVRLRRAFRALGLHLDLRRPVTGPLFAVLERLRLAARFRRRVALTSSATLPGPVSLGRAEICVPDRAVAGLDPSLQQGMLAHELGHLARRDPLWLLACSVLERVLFFQPLNAVLRRELQDASEYLCDDWAVRHTGGGVGLARCLAEVAGWRAVDGPVENEPALVATMAAQGSPLMKRVQRLLDEDRDVATDHGSRLWFPVGGALLAFVAVVAPGAAPVTDPPRPAARPVADPAPAPTAPARPVAEVLLTQPAPMPAPVDDDVRVFRAKPGQALKLQGANISVTGGDDEVQVIEIEDGFAYVVGHDGKEITELFQAGDGPIRWIGGGDDGDDDALRFVIRSDAGEALYEYRLDGEQADGGYALSVRADGEVDFVPLGDDEDASYVWRGDGGLSHHVDGADDGDGAVFWVQSDDDEPLTFTSDGGTWVSSDDGEFTFDGGTWRTDDGDGNTFVISGGEWTSGDDDTFVFEGGGANVFWTDDDGKRKHKLKFKPKPESKQKVKVKRLPRTDRGSRDREHVIEVERLHGGDHEVKLHRLHDEDHDVKIHRLHDEDHDVKIHRLHGGDHEVKIHRLRGGDEDDDEIIILRGRNDVLGTKTAPRVQRLRVPGRIELRHDVRDGDDDGHAVRVRRLAPRAHDGHDRHDRPDRRDARATEERIEELQDLIEELSEELEALSGDLGDELGFAFSELEHGFADAAEAWEHEFAQFENDFEHEFGDDFQAAFDDFAAEWQDEFAAFEVEWDAEFDELADEIEAGLVEFEFEDLALELEDAMADMEFELQDMSEEFAELELEFLEELECELEAEDCCDGGGDCCADEDEPELVEVEVELADGGGAAEADGEVGNTEAGSVG